MKKINCPRCKKETVYDVSNESRPFCSDRCKVIDTADWASENFRIPGEEVRNESEIPESDQDLN